ncbi:MAG: phosphoglycerol transferase [Arenicella sp.]
MRQSVSSIAAAIILIIIHYSVTNNPLWQHALVGASLGLIVAAAQSLASSKPSSFWKKVFIVLLFLGFFVLDSIYLLSSVFTADGITEQALAHLNLQSFNSGANSELANYHFAVAAIAALLILALFSVSSITNRSAHGVSAKRSSLTFLPLALVAIALHPGSFDLSQHWWYSAQTGDTDVVLLDVIESGYIDKKSIENIVKQRSKAKKKSVVLIYLESWERAYLDQNTFPKLASNLAALDAREHTYGQFKSSFFAKHTIAGLVSSLCGVPYAATGGSTGHVINNGAGDYYMPHVQCLGDITKQLGYHNVFYQGGDLSFTQKGSFFKSHGFDEVKGIHQLMPDVAEENRSSWGLHDDILFGLARERIDELAEKASTQPFLFTLLTLDTHDPYGSNKTSRWCNRNGKSTYPGSKDHKIKDQVYCSDAVVGKFVQELRDKYADTVDIYLVADHLAHAHSLGPTLRNQKDRKLIFIGIDDAQTKLKGNRSFTHLDIAPTILDQITNGFIRRMGMGVSVVGRGETLIEKFGDEPFNRKIRDNLRSLADRYWEYPSIVDSTLVFNQDTYELAFAGTSFPSPILFNLNEKNEISSYHSFAIHNYLTVSTDIGRVVSVQKCGDLAIYQANTHPKDDFCLMVGNLGSASLYLQPIVSGQPYSLQSLTNYLDQPASNSRLRERLFENPSASINSVASSASSEIRPLSRTQFITGASSTSRMVTNYWNLSLFEKFRGFKNYKAANKDGLYFFEVSQGRVELLNIWNDCSELQGDKLSSAMSQTSAREFVLMSGGVGLDCQGVQSNSQFNQQLSALRLGHSLIAHLNFDSGNYRYLKDQQGRKVELNLIEETLYSHYQD